MSRVDMTGQRFGRLTVTKFSHRKTTHTYWFALCDCGTPTVVDRWKLIHGHTTSCGCLHRELSAARAAATIKHGGARRGNVGREYWCWRGMIERCENPKNTNYIHYGGRGISVCPEWRNDFAAFLAHIGPRPSRKYTVDRFPDNDGNYEPGNVRCATALEQAHNKRSRARVAQDKARFYAKRGLAAPDGEASP